MASAQSWTVRPVGPDDRDRWQQLYEGYLAFYETALTGEQLATVWSWLMDDDHEVCGLLAEGASGVVGLAHYREFSRPSSASVGGYLDDLFVHPAARGSGAVDALLAALRTLGAERGWSVVRWITAGDNARARSAYARQARLSPMVTYDMVPPSAPAG